MTTVSIALCTYNGERFLQQQLDSLALQTHLPDEVIVSDDASVDGTIAILERWKDSVPFTVKIYHHQPNGVNKNFENALYHCTKDVILVCDQDDIWKKEKIETLLNILDENPNIGAVYHDAILIDENNELIPNLTMAQYVREYMVNCFPVFINTNVNVHYNPSGCCTVYRRSLLEKTFPIPECMVYDLWLSVCFDIMSKRKSISDCLIEHRMHHHNVSTAPNYAQDVMSRLKKSYIGPLWYYLSYKLYMDSLPIINAVRERIDSFPDSKYKTEYVKFLEQTYEHLINRTRIQRNAILFFPFLFREMFQKYGYFHFFQPFKAILYDCKVGLYNAFNPFSIITEIKNILSKLRKK